MSCTTIVSASALTTTLVTECSTTVLATTTFSTTLEVGIGPRGPVGPAGPSGLTTYAKKSVGALSAHRVVRTTDATHVDYCDANTSAHRDSMLGVAITAAGAAEEDVTVVGLGEVTEGSWSWTPGAPIYCGPSGVLTQTFSPAWAWSRIVGFAETSTKILVSLREPIALT